MIDSNTPNKAGGQKAKTLLNTAPKETAAPMASNVDFDRVAVQLHQLAPRRCLALAH